MAGPHAPSWEDLHVACVHEIFCRIPCVEDRHSAYLACPAWIKALAEANCQPPKVPRALPWLLLPAPNPNGSTRAVCVLSGCSVHQDHRYPAVILRGARCFGSHAGAWLFLAIRDPHGHRLLNVRTGGIRELPGKVELFLDLLPSVPFVVPMTIHAAALSAVPDDPGCCVAVSIVTTNRRPHVRCVARWRMGQDRAFEIRPPVPFLNPSYVDAEDVVYHDGAFHLLLSRSDDISVCTPHLLPDNRSTDEWQDRAFLHPGGHNYDQPVRDRYLVSSRGELLMVVRFTPRANEPTSNFRVFRATRQPLMPGIDLPFPVPVDALPWEWSELDSLDGRVLFVGHGFSRSYEVDDYKGFKSSEAGIYFLDDGMFFVDVQGTLYPCSDNGRWSDGSVHFCFPPADPSCNSPPAWLLH